MARPATAIEVNETIAPIIQSAARLCVMFKALSVFFLPKAKTTTSARYNPLCLCVRGKF